MECIISVKDSLHSVCERFSIAVQHEENQCSLFLKRLFRCIKSRPNQKEPSFDHMFSAFHFPEAWSCQRSRNVVPERRGDNKAPTEATWRSCVFRTKRIYGGNRTLNWCKWDRAAFYTTDTQKIGVSRRRPRVGQTRTGKHRHATLNHVQNTQLLLSRRFFARRCVFYCESEKNRRLSLLKKRILLFSFMSCSWVESIWLELHKHY